MLGHPVLPAKYCIYIIAWQVKSRSNCVAGPGIRPQNGQRDDFTREPLCLLRSMQPEKTADITTGFPAKWRLRNERRNSILMTRHHTDLGSASDRLNQISYAARPIRSTTQTWIVTRHQYGICALVSQTSFGGETSSITKCFLRLRSMFGGSLSAKPPLTSVFFQRLAFTAIPA